MKEILLVEDDDVQAFLVERAFRRAGVANPIERVSDGQEALDLLRLRPEGLPGLMLLDLKMPRLTGFEVLEAIRADGRTRRLPVVIVTSSDSPADRERAAREGVLGYLLKPCDPEQIRCLVQRELLGFEPDTEPSR
ncbi:MAG: response regulator [Candidatus Wallbacteria bacterium]|nr:response regulator [Candidatus Wallbacteria bacterium]